MARGCTTTMGPSQGPSQGPGEIPGGWPDNTGSSGPDGGMGTGGSAGGTRPVGASCTPATQRECSGPQPTCLAAVDLGTGRSGIEMPGGYCSNASCTPNNDGTCGAEGVCVNPAGDGRGLCLQRCA